MKKFLIYWLPVIAWAGVIFWLSGMPDLNSGMEQDFVLRKIAHVVEYFILAGLLWRAFNYAAGLGSSLVVWPAVIALTYACSDEFHQTFVAGRNGTAEDVFIDAIGIVTFVIGISLRRKNV